MVYLICHSSTEIVKPFFFLIHDLFGHSSYHLLATLKNLVYVCVYRQGFSKSPFTHVTTKFSSMFTTFKKQISDFESCIFPSFHLTGLMFGPREQWRQLDHVISLTTIWNLSRVLLSVFNKWADISRKMGILQVKQELSWSICEGHHTRGLTKVSVTKMTFGFSDSRSRMIQWDFGKVKIIALECLLLSCFLKRKYKIILLEPWSKMCCLGGVSSVSWTCRRTQAAVTLWFLLMKSNNGKSRPVFLTPFCLYFKAV